MSAPLVHFAALRGRAGSPARLAQCRPTHTMSRRRPNGLYCRPFRLHCRCQRPAGSAGTWCPGRGRQGRQGRRGRQGLGRSRRGASRPPERFHLAARTSRQPATPGVRLVLGNVRRAGPVGGATREGAVPCCKHASRTPPRSLWQGQLADSKFRPIAYERVKLGKMLFNLHMDKVRFAPRLPSSVEASRR